MRRFLISFLLNSMSKGVGEGTGCGGGGQSAAVGWGEGLTLPDPHPWSPRWTSHGVCAGVTDSADFFTQVCSLATAPLAVMASIRDEGGDLDAMAAALEKQGCVGARAF